MWKRWLGFWVIAWELFLQDVLAFSLEPLSNQLGFGMWERRDFKNGLLCGKDGTYLSCLREEGAWALEDCPSSIKIGLASDCGDLLVKAIPFGRRQFWGSTRRKKGAPASDSLESTPQGLILLDWNLVCKTMRACMLCPLASGYMHLWDTSYGMGHQYSSQMVTLVPLESHCTGVPSLLYNHSLCGGSNYGITSLVAGGSAVFSISESCHWFTCRRAFWGPPTPTGAIAPASVATIPTSDGASGTASNSIQESAQGKFVNAPPHVLPGPSFSYSGIPHVTTASGTSQQLPSGSVISSNPLASTVVFQTPVPGPSSSSGPSFSYNIAHKGAGFPGSQPFQSSTSIASGPRGPSPNAASFSFNGNPQLVQKDQTLKSSDRIGYKKLSTWTSPPLDLYKLKYDGCAIVGEVRLLRQRRDFLQAKTLDLSNLLVDGDSVVTL
ncbi:hypothetical protein CK203_092905 [Vitis vinifera]|uniref:Uncharacterized protein n=1 Tax=Vitis vinifera TaxID=29760 RepID=A0A438EJK1_VITVI|nr:hypothetical protein CK203_092905 [Vitis vinifera]